MEKTRYCQRCAQPQTLANSDEPNPCRKCGGTNFADRPKAHAWRWGVYELTDEDKALLVVNKIDPEEEVEGWHKKPAGSKKTPPTTS